jgi:hypothetical protein
MIKTHHPADWASFPDLWEPVLGVVEGWVMSRLRIFSPGGALILWTQFLGQEQRASYSVTKKDSFTEDTFDKGLIAIVPNVQTNSDAEELRAREKNNPKEYKAIVLDWTSPRIKEALFSKRFGVQSLEDLHNNL